jgi:hypothetical protein
VLGAGDMNAGIVESNNSAMVANLAFIGLVLSVLFITPFLFAVVGLANGFITINMLLQHRLILFGFCSVKAFKLNFFSDLTFQQSWPGWTFTEQTFDKELEDAVRFFD